MAPEIKTIEQTSDELIYRSYAFNREQFPNVAPERWSKIFQNVEQMEARFRAEHSTE